MVTAAAALAFGIAGSAPAAPQRTPPPPAGAALAALSQPPVRPAIAGHRIYFVLTDRYANGNPANDRGGATGGRTLTGFDPTDPGWFHGGDFAGLTGDCTGTKTGLARLKDLGFNAIWMTPPYGQRTVQGDSAAYHGYWITGFDRIDPHLGTDAEFGAFVECAHRLGMKVYLDVVVNHTGDVILPTGGSSFLDPAEVPYRDCRGRRFDPARYTTRTFPCLRTSNMPRVPIVPTADRAAKSPAWLNDPTRYHNRGDVSFDSCSELCFEQGDFFGLDDLFTEQPVVMRGLADVYGEWIRKYRVDGFRIDTARHVNRAFFRLWVPRILATARAAGVPDFQIFGEAFLTDTTELAVFVRDRGLPNVLDFPLQDAIVRFAGGSAGSVGIRNRLRDDDYFQTADGVAHVPPTFIGNHDIGRAALKIQEQTGASVSPDELLRRTLLAHSLLYLLRGAPVEYYGDEVGIVGRGGDKQARHDLFPTQVAEWRSEPRIGGGPIGAGSAFDVTAGHPVAEHLKALSRLREAHPVFWRGNTVVRIAEGPRLLLSRFDPVTRREYVIAVNASKEEKQFGFATATPSATWTPLLGASTPAQSRDGGNFGFFVPPLSAVVYVADREPRAGVGAGLLVVQRDRFTDYWRVGIRDPDGPNSRSVTFAVWRASTKRWQRLAADDSPPYRAFLDPQKFRRNEQVYLSAVVRSLGGDVVVWPVRPFVVRR